MKTDKHLKAEDIIIEAKATLIRLSPGTEFKLKDLFKGVSWDAFPRKERVAAGTIFKNEVDAGRLPVIFTGKTSSNSAVYKKK